MPWKGVGVGLIFLAGRCGHYDKLEQAGLRRCGVACYECESSQQMHCFEHAGADATASAKPLRVRSFVSLPYAAGWSYRA
eukprot:3529146-Pleurochrysis_carterae.AAC.1